jgi:hypothetical protein
MKLRVYLIDQNTGTETLQSQCALGELFHDELLQTAERDLLEVGEHRIGGGAAPLFLLLRIPEIPSGSHPLAFVQMRDRRAKGLCAIVYGLPGRKGIEPFTFYARDEQSLNASITAWRNEGYRVEIA